MKTNIEKVKQLIGKRMPSELIDFDDTDLVDKTNRLKFEMQSEEEIELNSNRYYMLEQRRHQEMYDDFEEDEDEGEEDPSKSATMRVQCWPRFIYTSILTEMVNYQTSKSVNMLTAMEASPVEHHLIKKPMMYLNYFWNFMKKAKWNRIGSGL